MAEIDVAEDTHVCASCVRRLATLALGESHEASTSIWNLGDEDDDPTLEKLRDDVARNLPSDAADARLALAEAYRCMGLYADALREAAMVLAAARRVRTAADAVAMLMTPPLLSADGMTRLRARLADRLDC